MKTLKLLTALALPLTLLAPQTYADNNRGFFAGAGVSAINVDDSPAFDMGLGEERLYLDEPYESIALGAGEELTMDIDHYSAIYYRAEAVNQTGRFYALLGYADIEFTMKGSALSETLSEDDFSWGLGAGFILNPHLNLNFEYRNLLDVNEYRFTTITASLDYRF